MMKIVGLLLTICATVVLAPALAADQAIVSKRTIYPGQIIDGQYLKAVVLTKRPTIRYRFVTDQQQIIGLVAAKTILPGRFIPVVSARVPSIVKSGTPIWVTMESGLLAIRLLCTALADGGVGDRITLRNTSSGKVFVGIVRSDGSVVASGL